jgi:hypothetical protein
MKFSVSPIILGSLAVFLATPWIPTPVIKFLVGNPIGVFALLALSIVIVMYNIIDGLAFFLASGVLFLENRKRILSHIEKGASGDDGSGKRKSTHSSVDYLPADDLVDGEVHPEHDKPSEDESSFNPKDDSGSNKFDPVDETINEKVPPETLSGSADSMAEKYVRDGLA